MSRIIFVAMMLAVTIAGCNRFPDLSLQVTAVLQPSDDCGVTADQEETWARGRYDLAVVADYTMWTRIVSYLVDNSLDFQGSTSNMQVTSFDVTIKLPDGSVPALSGDLPNPYNVRTSAFIPPSTPGGEPAADAAVAPVIPSSYQAAVADVAAASGFDSIVLDVRANGTTSGGFNQQSPPFSFPIELCFGCLGTSCPAPAEVGDGLGCFPGQDSWQYCDEIVAPEPTP